MKYKEHRKIWENAHGKIPVDDEGRTFEVHHINGDATDDRIENLIAVSIQEHFDIHHSQGDFGACQAIAMRMGLNVSDLAKKSAEKRIKNGTHNFLKSNRTEKMGNEFTSENASVLASERASNGELPAQVSAKNGEHHWQSEEHSLMISKRNKRFGGTVTATDLEGNTFRVSKEMFEMRDDLVGSASKEAKRRKLLNG